MSLLKFLATVIVTIVPCSASAEVYQLTPITRVEEPALLKDASPEELLERERGKKFVMAFLKASTDEKFRLTSEHYKKRDKSDAEALRKLFDKESYYKIDFQEVTFFDMGKDKHLTIKADVYWVAEGYGGNQTVYFMLIKAKGRWLLDGLVY